MLTFTGLFFQKLSRLEKEKLFISALQNAGINVAKTSFDPSTSQFLQDVVYGRQEEVNAKLQIDPGLLLATGAVIDPSGRKAFSVSAYQCAVKCLDVQMMKMLQSHIAYCALSTGMDHQSVAQKLLQQQDQAFIYEFYRVKIVPESLFAVYKNRAIQRNEIIFSYSKTNPLAPVQLGYCVQLNQHPVFKILTVQDPTIIKLIKDYVSLTKVEESIHIFSYADLKKIERYLTSISITPQFDSSVGYDALELLIQEIQAFIQHYPKISDPLAYCKKMIGGMQSELPANILQELCRQDGQQFSSLAYKILLPRTSEYHSNSGDLKPLIPFAHDRENGLGKSFALFRFPEHKHASDNAYPSNQGERPRNIELIRLKKDLEWYLRLQEERLHDIQLLTNNLKKMTGDLVDNSECLLAPNRSLC